MPRVKQRYVRSIAEKRFERVYHTIEGERCIYCGIANDGKFDHQPPVYVLHRFADGGLVTKRKIREHFGECKLVPCCTICNMGLGAYHGTDDDDRRREIMNWFLADERYPEDPLTLEIGRELIRRRLESLSTADIYEFPGVGRVIYINALLASMTSSGTEGSPSWLQQAQSELADWLRGSPRRKSAYFLAMANLESYELRPHARDDPRGQFFKNQPEPSPNSCLPRGLLQPTVPGAWPSPSSAAHRASARQLQLPEIL